MSSDEQRAIFDEFAQLHRPHRSHRDGAGLGLAIARRIVEAHQGTLRVSSEVGRGSTFTFTIPTNLQRSEIHTAVSA
jgi:signal transduction histidine kinase